MPASHYQTLGIDPSASKEQVKQAYRQKALRYHPDLSDEEDARQRFVAVTEAYEVLRDDTSRAAYDAVRARASGGASAFGSPGPGPWQGPTGSEGFGKDFDADFEKWWRARGFGSQVDEEILRERRSAQRRARAAAWEAEKADASENKARSDRLRWRTANARAERHSRVLSRHWQTYAGLCWQDVLVMGLFVAGTVCAGALVRPVRKPPEPAG